LLANGKSAKAGMDMIQVNHTSMMSGFVEWQRLREEEREPVCHEEAFFCRNEPVVTDRYQAASFHISKKVVGWRLRKGAIKSNAVRGSQAEKKLFET
jgi:hypothetical protein